MALYQVVVALLLLSIVNAKPATEMDSAKRSESESLKNIDIVPLEKIEAAAQSPQVYLIIADSVDDPDTVAVVSSIGDEIEKRSAQEVDDLETAAGTNVLRPLFVYRQQLAYRERVKKGAFRRSSGFRPRFE